MSEIEYYKDLKQSRKDKTASIVMTLLSILAMVIWKDKVSVLIAAIGSLIVGIYLMKSSFRTDPNVLVNKEGIKILANGIGLVPWKEISGFERRNGANAEFVSVQLTNADELMSRQVGITKFLMSSTAKRLGSPVVIPQPEFGKPLNEVMNELNNARTTYNNMS